MSEPLIDERIARIEQGILVASTLERGEATSVPLAERLAFHGVPGVSVAVIEGGEIAWERGFGLRKAGSSDPVTPDTLFLAGSISKPVTALAVMRLVDEGKLDLDEDVNQYLRSWQVPANGDWQPRLTLRHLLSHTAGLTVHGFPGYPRWLPVPTVPQILNGEPPSNTPAVRVNLTPGTRFRYSGGGTTVVQLLLTDVLGTPFPELMRDLVLEPLGMRASTYANPLPEAYWSRVATGHRTWAEPLEGDWPIYPEMAAAGLWTTAGDLARCALGVQRARAGAPGALLSRARVEEMLTPVVEAAFRPDQHIGIGFFTWGDEGALYFGHGGSDIGFTANFSASQDGSYGVLVMTNGDAWHASEVISELERTIADAYEWPGFTPATAPLVPLDPSTTADLTGSYELRPGFTLTVERDAHDGSLSLRAPGQPPIPLGPVSERTFVATAVNAEIEFVAGDDGEALLLRQDGLVQRARRLG